MKKTITIIAFIVLLGSTAIANGLSELNLRTNSNVPLKVIIDGQLVSNNTSFVKIKSIPFGKHSIQIFRVLRNYNSYNEEPLFIGEVFLPQNTITNALIKHHKFVIEQQSVLNQNPQGVIYNYQASNYYETKPIFWENEHHSYNQVVVPVVCEKPPKPYFYEPIVEVFPMNKNNFNKLKATINNQWFSDEKILVLTQALTGGHLFTTNQVKELIELYSFSQDKLDVAKLVFKNTIDKENYYVVFNSLQWNSSKENLSNYIASL